MFGQDVGVAFLLLGKIKYKLKQKEDATSCFRIALKHNPFLWSALVSLYETGGWDVQSLENPTDYFKMSEYPSFLRPHTHSMSVPGQQVFASQPKATGVQPQNMAISSDVPSNAADQTQGDLLAESASTRNILDFPHHDPSAFKPVVVPMATKKNQVCLTPDIFHGPSMGHAIASSTPTPGAPRNLGLRDRLLPSLGVWSEGVGGRETLEWSHPFIGPVKAALDFGSASSRCSGRNISQAMTPIQPRSV